MAEPRTDLDKEVLLAKAKNYLNVTWEDHALNEKIMDIMVRGITYLDRIAGEPLPYTDGNPELGLLMNYVLYERSNQLDVFQRNYIHELNALQIDAGVNRYVTPE